MPPSLLGDFLPQGHARFVDFGPKHASIYLKGDTQLQHNRGFCMAKRPLLISCQAMTFSPST